MLLARPNRDKSTNVKSDATGRALIRLCGESPLLGGSLGPPGADRPVGLHPFPRADLKAWTPPGGF
jgi:hypothetical protein